MSKQPYGRKKSCVCACVRALDGNLSSTVSQSNANLYKITPMFF